MKYIFETKHYLKKADALAYLKSVAETEDKILITAPMELKAIVDEKTGNIVFCNEKSDSKKVVEVIRNDAFDYSFVAISIFAIVISVVSFFIK